MGIDFTSPNTPSLETCRPVPEQGEGYSDNDAFAHQYICGEIAKGYPDGVEKCDVVTPVFQYRAEHDAFMSGRGALTEDEAKIQKFILESAETRGAEKLLCQGALDRWVLEKHPAQTVIKKRRGAERRKLLDFFGGQRLEKVRAVVIHSLQAAGKIPAKVSTPSTDNTGAAGTAASGGTAAPDATDPLADLVGTPEAGGPTGIDETDVGWWMKPEWISLETAMGLAGSLVFIRKIPARLEQLGWLFRSTPTFFKNQWGAHSVLPLPPLPFPPRPRSTRAILWPTRTRWTWNLLRLPVWGGICLGVALMIYGADRYLATHPKSDGECKAEPVGPLTRRIGPSNEAVKGWAINTLTETNQRILGWKRRWLP